VEDSADDVEGRLLAAKRSVDLLAKSRMESQETFSAPELEGS